ncbi:cysteine desulfurase [Acidaminobacter sp. JC074]|uniref:cysteine desulfurase n=1 Tax=Acidaminobacter sp. JC074 TaxID=2530199 RepID=UPI001F0D516F|nr:cysteine desulfurase [Acidaminobacter sp. JC074]MCH4885979.1 cysteine desulfurase [Acidaminobacter sp. JC074]
MLYKKDFEIFNNHPDLIYLDNAATSQKPNQVIDAISDYYKSGNGSPHRGAHHLSVVSTQIYNEGRRAVRDFIHASRDEEIIFTRNATEALNLIAYAYVKDHLKEDHNIVLSITNHHSNIIPFQRLCHQVGAELRYLYCDENGHILEDQYEKIDENTFLVSIPMISNGIGVKHDVKSVFDRADMFGVLKLLDAAQAVGHEHVDVKELNADLLVFSGHKMFAPQGIGVLYGKFDLLNKFQPFLSGGDMIEYVEEQTTTYADLPERLEAGTQNVEGVLGLKKAIDYINDLGLDRINKHEALITSYAYETLKALDYIEVYGDDKRGSLVTFNVKEVHPHDVASILDSHHVAIRAGHHCCQPLMKYLNHPSTCRASFSLFNTKEDVDKLVMALEAVKEVFYE